MWLSRPLLCLSALALLLPAASAWAGNSDYTYAVSFTTPADALGKSGDIALEFNPTGSGAPSASITASNLNYSNDWSVNTLGIQTYGIRTQSPCWMCGSRPTTRRSAPSSR